MYITVGKNFVGKERETDEGIDKGCRTESPSKWRQGVFIISRRTIPSALFIDSFLHVSAVNDKIDEWDSLGEGDKTTVNSRREYVGRIGRMAVFYAAELNVTTQWCREKNRRIRFSLAQLRAHFD